jgi:hypothetical protein
MHLEPGEIAQVGATVGIGVKKQSGLGHGKRVELAEQADYPPSL